MTKQIVELSRKLTTRIKSISFHPTFPIFITAHHCGAVQIWNYLYNQVVCVLKEHIGSVRVVKIHPSGDFFATAGDDKIVRVWNYKTKAVIYRLKGHTDYIRSIDFHPTKTWIVSASDDCLIKIWDFNTGKLLSSTTGHTHYVMSVLFVDSTHLVTCSLDHNINLWDASNIFKKKKLLVPDMTVLQTIEAHSKGVNFLYMKDNYLISGSDDREVKIWKYQNESIFLEKQHFPHEGNVFATFYDDKIFYSGGEDKRLMIYDNKKIIKIDVESRIWAIEGKDNCLVVGTDDGVIVYRNQDHISFDYFNDEIYYSLGKSIFIYNFKESKEIFKMKENVKGIQCVRNKMNSVLINESNISNVNVHSKYESNIKYENNSKYEYDSTIVNENKNNENKIIVNVNNGFDYIIDSSIVKGKKEGSECMFNNDTYSYIDGILYKNNEILSNIKLGGKLGRLISGNIGVYFISDKTLLSIGTGKSIYVNFEIKSVTDNGVDKVAVLGNESILFLDLELKTVEQIKEKVEITGGFFFEDFFIYCTLKQVKFNLNGSGVIQSLETFSIPICIRKGFLYFMTPSGIDKCFLNLSEIRFRRAVIQNDNIIGVIETEQLPGLSPLEYLIKEGRGAIALPYIKDKEKIFELYVSDKNYGEAYKICDSVKMYEKLGVSAMTDCNYEIAENCYKKSGEVAKLFFLYLSTKQFEKLRGLEGSEVDSMCDVIKLGGFNRTINTNSNTISDDSNSDNKPMGKPIDKSISKSYSNSMGESDSKSISESMANININTSSKSDNKAMGKSIDRSMDNISNKSISKSDNKAINNSDNKAMGESDSESISKSDSKSIDKSMDNISSKPMGKSDSKKVDNKFSKNENNNSEILTKIKNIKVEDRKNYKGKAESTESSNSNKISKENSGDSEILSNLQSLNMDSEELRIFETELATNNDSECNYFNLDEYSLEYDGRAPESIYMEALDYTTKGNFTKAVEFFRTCIYSIAINFKENCRQILREKIGVYLLGLRLEKERRKEKDPSRNIEMAVIFSNLKLEDVHTPLSKNLAMSTCFKCGNYKTAKKLAENYPQGKDAERILASEFSDDKYVINENLVENFRNIEGSLCYDSLAFEGEFRQCFLCFNKVKEDVHYCPACNIGIIQH